MGFTGGKKKKNTKVSETVQEIKEVVGLAEPVAPERLANQNRVATNDMVNKLNVIKNNFEIPTNLDMENPDDAKYFEKIKHDRLSIQAIAAKMSQAPTIFDDNKKLNEVMKNLVDILDDSIKSKRQNQTDWAINALSYCAYYALDNIPAHFSEEEKERLQKDRLEYIKTYQTIVKLYGEIDANDQIIATKRERLKMLAEEYKAGADKLEKYLATNEGKDTEAKLSAYNNDPVKISADKEAMQLNLDMQELAAISSNVILVQSELLSLELNQKSKHGEAMAVANALDNRPNIYDPELAAKINEILDEMVDKTIRLMDEAEANMENLEHAASKMKAAMGGRSMEKMITRTLNVIEEVLNPEQYDDVKIQRERLLKDEKRKRRLEKLAQAQALAQANAVKNVEVEIDYNAVVDTAVNYQEDTNEDTEMNYNVNS